MNEHALTRPRFAGEGMKVQLNRNSSQAKGLRWAWPFGLEEMVRGGPQLRRVTGAAGTAITVRQNSFNPFGSFGSVLLEGVNEAMAGTILARDQPRNAVTACVWFWYTAKPRSANSETDIFNNSNSWGFAADLAGNRELSFSVIGATSATRSASLNLDTLWGSWISAVGVYEGSSARLDCYINGWKANTITGTVPATLNSNTAIRIGQSAAGGTGAIRGYFFDARIYDRALSDNEVAELVGNPMDLWRVTRFYPADPTPAAVAQRELLGDSPMTNILLGDISFVAKNQRLLGV